MYSEQFKESLALVEAAREKNIALEPRRMTAQEKDMITHGNAIAMLKKQNIAF